MYSLQLILESVIASLFFPSSNGLRRRGPMFFFKDVGRWRIVGRVIKPDIVSCSDSIDHDLMTKEIKGVVGKVMKRLTLLFLLF